MRTFLFFLCFFVVFNSQAQLLENLKGKATNSATNRSTDFNTTRSNKEKLINSNEQEQNGGGNQDGDVNEISDDENQVPNTNVQVEDVYTFNTKLTYSYQVFNEAEVSELLLISYFFGSENYSQLIGSNLMINDAKNKAVVMVDESTSMAFATTDSLTTNLIGQEPSNELSSYTKTGSTKEILGYQCEEYVVSENSTKISIWITNDPKITAIQLAEYRRYSTIFIENFMLENVNGNGILLEISQYDEQNKLIFQLLATEFLQEEKIIDLRNYQVTKM